MVIKTMLGVQFEVSLVPTLSQTARPNTIILSRQHDSTQIQPPHPYADGAGCACYSYGHRLASGPRPPNATKVVVIVSHRPWLTQNDWLYICITSSAVFSTLVRFHAGEHCYKVSLYIAV